MTRYEDKYTFHKGAGSEFYSYNSPTLSVGSQPR
jgi:hypothetical protein